MTLSPLDDRRVKGIPGPQYQLNDFCPVPGCPHDDLERHHLWRRSAIGGDYWWVEIPYGLLVYPNCVKLCLRHHKEVTENRAKMIWTDENELSYVDLSIGAIQVLDWQPPLKDGSLINKESDSEISQKNTGTIDHEAPGHTKDTCPTCLRPIPKQREEREGAKLRKTWSVAVPQELWEDGSEVITTLIEEARKELAKAGLPYGDEGTVKYHVLATALSMFVLHGQEIMSNG